MNKPAFNFKEVAPCFLAVLIDVLGFSIVYPVFTAFFTADNGLFPLTTPDEVRFFYLGLSFVLYPLMMFFGSILLGHFSDRLGRKKILLMCMFGLGVGYSIIGFGAYYRSLLWLLIGRSFSGLMAASEPIALAAIADLSNETNKALHMSYVAVAQSVGFVFGPLIGGVFSDSSILHYFDYGTPFYISAFLSFVTCMWILLSFQETKSEVKEKKAFAKPSELITAFKHPKIVMLITAFFFMQVGMSCYYQIILIELQEKFAYNSLKMGLFNGYLGIWYAAMLICIAPFIVKKYKIEWITAASLGITASFQLWTGLTHDEIIIWLVAIPFAAAVQLAYTGMFATLSNAGDKRSQGLIMGLAGSIIALSIAFSGFSPNLIPYLTTQGIIILGSCLLFIGSGCLYYYSKYMLKNS